MNLIIFVQVYRNLELLFTELEKIAKKKISCEDPKWDYTLGLSFRCLWYILKVILV
jgi:hypothetical protein